MGEIAGLAVAFSVAGLFVGLVTGWLGNRWVFLACFGLAVGVAIVLAVQAALSNSAMSSLEQIVYAALAVWGALVALAVHEVIKALRARRSGRAYGSEDTQP
ncbi:MAG: hypothetical protein V4720_14880 [Pseudomonadota bacterium]